MGLTAEQIKEKLEKKGLIENGLFAYGSRTSLLGGLDSAAGSLFSGKTNSFAFTLVGDELLMIPYTAEDILADAAVRLKKGDVQKVVIQKKLLGMIFEILTNDGSRQEFNIAKPTDNIEAIVKKFNS